MKTVKLDISPGAEVLTYQMKAARQIKDDRVVFPELCLEEDSRRFAYDLPESVQAFSVRVSGEELKRAEGARDAAVAAMADTLLDGDRVLFSADTVYRRPDGEFVFLYYPADPVPEELCRRMLPVARQVTFETEMARNGEVREILMWVAAAVCCYILYVLIAGVTTYAWIISLAAYGVLCGGEALYRRYGAGRSDMALACAGTQDVETTGIPDFPNFMKGTGAGSQQKVSERAGSSAAAQEAPGMYDDGDVPELIWGCGGTARLVSVFDPSEVADIDKDDFRIGRNPEATDFQVQDRFVNPVHAVITRRDGDYAITDRCSRNGTFVNGVRIEPETPFPLYGNEEIRLGKELYRFMITDE